MLIFKKFIDGNDNFFSFDKLFAYEDFDNLLWEVSGLSLIFFSCLMYEYPFATGVLAFFFGISIRSSSNVKRLGVYVSFVSYLLFLYTCFGLKDCIIRMYLVIWLVGVFLFWQWCIYWFLILMHWVKRSMETFYFYLMF